MNMFKSLKITTISYHYDLGRACVWMQGDAKSLYMANISIAEAQALKIGDVVTFLTDKGFCKDEIIKNRK